eukprot:354565-Chlamydomonas_euryale.AAC.6
MHTFQFTRVRPTTSAGMSDHWRAYKRSRSAQVSLPCTSYQGWQPASWTSKSTVTRYSQGPLRGHSKAIYRTVIRRALEHSQGSDRTVKF